MIAARFSARGFTLAEVLISLAIFAAMGTLAYLTLSQAIVLRDRLGSERAHWHGLAVAFARMEDDFSQARARATRDNVGAMTPAFTGSTGTLTRSGEAMVEFTRGGAALDADRKRSDLQRVGYALKDDSLLRLHWPTPDPAPGSKPSASRILDQVRQVRIQYLGNDRAWLDDWPPRNAPPTSVPLGVKVSLGIRDRGEYSRVFVIHD